jgi:Carboxypeptidase regulatory-like domain/TonB-dependent Receptor Plug Domain
MFSKMIMLKNFPSSRKNTLVPHIKQYQTVERTSMRPGMINDKPVRESSRCSSFRSGILHQELISNSSSDSAKESLRAAGRFTVLAIIVTLLLSTSLLRAQVEGTGTIEGIVLDTSGAVISRAIVTATNSATGRKFSQQTSGAGSYALVALPPGEYTVDVHAAGFGSVIQEHVTVNALSQVGLNISLRVGSNVQDVVVSAAPPELETENGTVETTIPNTTYEALPLAMNGGPKNPVDFLSLVPGVNENGAFTPVINGGSAESMVIYINGLPLASSELQGGIESIGLFSTEAVDQFQVITSGVPANYDGQGIANLVLKSGTNHIHGTLYENIRNTAFDAAGYFTRGPAPVEHQNEFGFTVGGPVLHDRLFYFGSYDNFKITQGSSPAYVSLPTPAERTGDFSALLPLGIQIYDPSTTLLVGGVLTRQPFLNNQVPINSHVASSLQSYLPAPQNSGTQNNYFNTYVNGNKNDIYLGRVDATLSSNNHATFLFAKTSYAPLSVGSYLPLPYSSTVSGGDTYYFGQVSDTQVITPNLLNVFGAQLLRTETIVTNLTIHGGYPEKAGLAGLPLGQPSTAFPGVNFGGPESPTSWAQNTSAFAEVPFSDTLQDNLHWVHGRHSMTFGGQVVIEQEALSIPSEFNGFNFANTETAGFTPDGTINSNSGNAYASYLLGLVDSASATDTAVQETGGRWRNYAMYAQDDWKMAPKFTINIGLRYTIPKPFVEEHNRTSWLDPTAPNAVTDGAPGALEFAGTGSGTCNCRTDVKTHYLTFGPRLGFAYSLDDKTVVRTSFSIVHYNGGALGGNGEQQGVGNLGYSASPSFSSADGGITAAFNLDGGFSAYQHPPFFESTLGAGYTTTIPAGSGISYDRPKTAGRSPYTEEWNLTLERELPASMILSLSYDGTSSHFDGVQGGVGIYSNQINPKYLALGNLLLQTETPTTLTQAQAQFPGIKLPYANFAGSIGQMLQPFPQYSRTGATFMGPDPWADLATTSYNALQATLTHRMKNGLYFLAAYTWSKSFDEGGQVVQFEAQAPRSAYNLAAERTVSNIDVPQQLSFTEVYELPFGKGQLFGGSNRVLSALIGNWQISGIEQYSAGTPIGTIFGNCTDPYMGGVPLIAAAAPCYADYNPAFSGNAHINGKIGSGIPGATPYFNANAFQNAAPYTFGTTPRIIPSLRNEWGKNESIALAKTISIKENLKLQLKADAFNVFNRTQFGGIGTSITSSAFGQVNSQVNLPRQLQLEGYLRF